MKARTYCLILTLSIIAFAGCNNDEDSGKGNFEYNGNSYETLRQAVDAALQSAGDKTYIGRITLTDNAESDGISIGKGINKCFILDLDKYNLILNEGKCINTADCEAIIQGDGGSLSGNGTILSSSGGVLSFVGDINIKGGIETSSEAVFDECFTGSFEGDLTIGKNDVRLSSCKASFHINSLSVNDKESSLQIIDAPAEGISIDEIHSNADNPVCVFDAKSVNSASSGTTIHVHSFLTANTTEATCCSRKHITMKCPDCGFTYETEDGEDFGSCNRERLIHVAAIPATAMANGNIEYWICPDCGEIYSDEKANATIEGGPLLLATNYMEDKGFLHSLDNELCLKNEFDGTANLDPGSILSIIGLIESFAMSLPGLINDDSFRWNQINEKLNYIQDKLNIIDSKINQLSKKLSAETYKKIIADRQVYFNFLNTKSGNAFKVINDILKSQKSQEEKEREIRDVLSDWSKNSDSMPIADRTQSLIQQYFNTGLEKNVPGMFEEIANCSYLWEHDGYNFRYQAMAKDVILSGISYLMAGYYFSSVKTYDSEALRKADIDKLRKDLDDYKKTIQKDLDRMKDREAKLRRINLYNVSFTRTMESYSITGWLWNNCKKDETRFPRENTDNAAVNNCEKIISNMKGLPFSNEMAQATYKYYNRGNTNVSMRSILRDSLGIGNVPDTRNQIIVSISNGFDHDRSDVSLPTYRSFYWQAWRFAFADDFWGVRTVLSDNCGLDRFLLLPKCIISSYSDGHLREIKECIYYNFFYLVKSDVQ